MDEEAIRRVIAELADAWNSHDMDTWGMLFTDDADFVNRGGGWWKSNRENVEGHRAIHEMLTRRKQEMNFRLRADKISFLTPDIAIIHAMSEWPGSSPLSGERMATNGIMTMVMVKRDGKWLIRALQNTLVTLPPIKPEE